MSEVFLFVSHYEDYVIHGLGGEHGFRVGTKIQASGSAWVDPVWFNDRFDLGSKKEEKWTKTKI